MANTYIEMETLKFLLFNVHDLKGVLQQERFSEYDEESINMMLDSVKDFSDKEMYPYYKEMDENPAHFKDGEIIVHPQVTKYMKAGGEMGFLSGSFSYEAGGMQMPSMVVNASAFIQEAANNHLPGYIGLTVGAAELIEHFGNQSLKDTYVPKMMAGEWGGTMCLTEPQAGSSLSDIVTTAFPNGDSYKISGQKIFISGGDYKGAENIVHLVLARIKGAPAGTKGISLFVVPKNRLDDHGNLEDNNVTTVGDFQKMGQKGYCTTHLFFGDKEDCSGWLVGEPNKGLKYMFLMMNGARIAVGRGAAAIATGAYHASLNYAKERPQGRELQKTGKKDASQEQTMIINHPDVRRMLLLQKVITEGALSLVFLTSRYQDLSQSLPDAESREKYKLLLEILTPVVKTYPSEMGITSINNGVQVLGGYGFCSDYILQQYLRDIRISAIYEGTTGIQSQDLLGRKVTMENGKALQLLSEEIMNSIEESMAYETLRPLAEKLGSKLELTQKVLKSLMGYAKEGDYQRFLADATPFMEFFSTIVVAWQWLDIGREAQKAMISGDASFNAEFYENKIHAMQFYFKYELPKTTGLAEVLMDKQSLTLNTEKQVFA
ncbi:acyl-CoA dehydrogenase [Subsaximicrobium wynnwilliamsii]|uniref:Acyl-CoA dehydrogenase n=1 Tax=Subsaximicrobium wynnwilliamsii TaxID=291179 RepID=A0A5C6ZPN2_9FLAO|nr:acyl-CoA dehydrogenase [Subsaximicrobium wynnwilliamsii]TXD85259.1 acyl-CoA dehydrogenase [Subsaximicrobium wynnwilliamsii]TXD91301.1 acyl-CoA dehydrogenase [Subsaximicrobium wynnwilliamsii]TXE04695.1 acyl-CoA dehydrogenase [Subsaximicrobium wynnwilliamsii]